MGPETKSRAHTIVPTPIRFQPMPHTPNDIERRSLPIDLPDRIRRAPALLLFGGSFDPPHLGHTALPAAAARALAQRQNLKPTDVPVVYVPAARSPHKDHAPTPDHHRCAMLRAATADLDHPTHIWEQELADSTLNPGAPSYWADTWAILKRLRPGAPDRFLIGADQAHAMHRWHRFAEFWRDALVVLRGSDTPDTLIDTLRATSAWTDDDLDHWRNACIHAPLVDCASSDIRAALAQGTRPDDCLAPAVLDYITREALYTQ